MNRFLTPATGVIILLSLSVGGVFAQSTPRITEFLAINTTGLLDGNGKYSDWIEIHNPAATPVDLSGWHLTDTAQDLIRWTFPPGSTIAAGAYRLVFASNATTIPPGEWHANFSLNGDGEYLALVMPGGVTVVSEFFPTFPKQRKNVSYGRSTTPGDTNLYFFTTPTPGAANGSGVLGFVGDTQFSHKRGFYDAAFDLVISVPEPGSTIRYTLDGSLPTLAGNGTTYTAPIPIATTAIVRAQAYKTGYLSTNVDTQTYLFVASVLQQSANIAGWPNPSYSLGSGTGIHDYQMDPAIVNAPAYSGMINQAMRAIPTLSLVLPRADVFGAAGFYDTNDIEKATSVEVLYADTPLANEHADGGIEGHSHVRMKRSLRLNFRQALGNSTFKTGLFAKMPWNPPGVDSQDRLILRAGNNRAWSRSWSKEKTTYCEDPLARQTQLAVSGYGMRGAFVHLYINGLYWGLFDVTERADEHFTARYFGGESDDWFAINHGGTLTPTATQTRYNYLASTLKNKDMTVPANYAELGQYLDIEGFIDYLFVQWYPATGDWPTNNWYAGHRTPASPLGATPLRYFAWDGEWSWDLPHSGAPNPAPYHPWVHADFRKAKTKTQGGTIPQIFNSAKDSPLFLRTLADRAYRHLFNGGPMSDAAMQARFAALTTTIRDAVVGESARWGDTLKGSGQPTYTRDVHWQNEVNALTALMPTRATRFIAALRTEGYYPSINPPTFNQRGGSVSLPFSVVLTNPNASGSIRYTIDGSDPANGGALTYSAPIPLSTSVQIRTRILAGAEWSAIDEATFFVPAPPALRITELMYHPAPPTVAERAAGFTDQDDFEYIELFNRGPEAIQLQGMRFTVGVTFAFPSHLLASGARVLVVANLAAFTQRYGSGGFTVLGSYSPTRLANGGERVRLESSLGETIADFTYGDVAPWPVAADGAGYSLVFVDAAPGTDPALASNWRTSALPGGSPGGADTLTFAQWAAIVLAGRPVGDLAALADPDFDGVVNLIEYALGLHPLVADAASLPVPTYVGGVLSIDFQRALYKTDVVIQAETTSSLVASEWSTDGVSDTVQTVSGEIETRRAAVSSAGPARAFLRFRISIP